MWNEFLDKFKNKYRISSHRKPNWDYSADALYFITIVTQNRVCNLGKIVYSENAEIRSKEMILSEFGKIVEQEWFKSFEIRDELLLHDFVIMPNHLHAVIEIFSEKQNESADSLIDNGIDSFENDGIDSHANNGIDSHANDGIDSIANNGIDSPVQPHGRVALRGPWENPSNPSIERNPPIRLPKSISSFIAGFKSAVNTQIDNFINEHNLKTPKFNRNNHFFQPNYHDHIIRNHHEYVNISNYILNNPQKWDIDKFK